MTDERLAKDSVLSYCDDTVFFRNHARAFLLAARVLLVVPSLAGVFFGVVPVAFLTAFFLALPLAVLDFTAVVFWAAAFDLFDDGFFLLSGLADTAFLADLARGFGLVPEAAARFLVAFSGGGFSCRRVGPGASSLSKAAPKYRSMPKTADKRFCVGLWNLEP